MSSSHRQLTFESMPDRPVEHVPELCDTYAANDEKFGAHAYSFMMLAAAWTHELAEAALIGAKSVRRRSRSCYASSALSRERYSPSINR